MSKIHVAMALVGALLIGGCQKQPATDAQALLAQAPPPADTGTPPPAELRLDGGKGLFHATLNRPTCDMKSAAEISWDISKLGQSLASAEVWVGPDGARQIVAAGGTAQHISIPAWIQPGTVFTLRAPGGKEELDRIVIPGDACQAN